MQQKKPLSELDPASVFVDVATLLTELQAGKMVIILDDEQRENEGDLIMAAECVRSEDVNFMIKHGSGVICLPLTMEKCKQLALPLMVQTTVPKNRFTPNFTISIEAAHGVTTGISASDRATTIRAAAKADATAADIVQPGHVFPLMAKPGGVLERAGHTEASCDLMRLAGFGPVAVLVEILNDDGSVARRPQLEEFAKQHNLKISTVAALIQYRKLYDREYTNKNVPLKLWHQENKMDQHATTTICGNLTAPTGKIAIVASKFNQLIVDKLLDGALQLLQQHQVKPEQIIVARVPGAVELPVAVLQLAQRQDVAGVIALGAIIRGATAHFDYVANMCSSGLQNIALTCKKPVIFGVLTVDTLEQALERAGGKGANHGAESARACLEMIDLLVKLA